MAQQQQTGVGAPRVLLIEDEPHLTEAVSYLLAREGWTVHVHADGTSAMARLLETPPDALVLDVMLPGRSGYDILQELRAEAQLAALPVLILTARGQERDRALALSLGATAFLTKPFSNAEIVAVVREMLERGHHG